MWLIVEYRAKWCKIKQLLSNYNTGNSSNPPMEFITMSSPVWPHTHTQSVHKHKYYYFNLHSSITIPCPVWPHTHSQYTNTNIITSIYTVLSPYLVLSDHTQTHTHTHTVSTQTQISLPQSTQFYHHTLSCLTTHKHTFNTQTQILLLQSTSLFLCYTLWFT